MMTPSPTPVKQDLYSMQRLCARLAVEYTQAYEAGYLGVRKPNSDGTPKAKGAYSDPTGDIATGGYYESIRSDTLHAARAIDQAHSHLVSALKLLNNYVGTEGLAV